MNRISVENQGGLLHYTPRFTNLVPDFLSFEWSAVVRSNNVLMLDVRLRLIKEKGILLSSSVFSRTLMSEFDEEEALAQRNLRRIEDKNIFFEVVCLSTSAIFWFYPSAKGPAGPPGTSVTFDFDPPSDYFFTLEVAEVDTVIYSLKLD